ncbi:copper transport protein [Devosia enhydra]|uniref:Copper transport protein n=1 Tax=Devosia enhydra TaxID=665118 RepID=A0A1K2I1R5_9HYPH|nr:CopD family protein [Devosia enhydra]SFZ86273.1 copper transport protein [Devosia enhydra]
MFVTSPFGRMVLVLGLLFSLISIQPAWAHAQLLSTTPPAGAVLADEPESLSLAFNEPVTALVMTLVAPDGTRTDLLDGTQSGETVVVALPPSSSEGTHVLSWRVVSTDGHPIGGSLVFSIGMPSGGPVASGPEGDRVVSVALWAAKAGVFIALFFGVGGAVFGAMTVLPPLARTLALALGTAGLVLAPVSLGLHGLDALALPPGDIVTPSPWSAGLATSYGMTAVALALAMLLALVAMLRPGLRLLAVPAWLGGAVALSLSGHAGAAEPQSLTRPAVALHVAGLLFWVGALPPLLLLLAQKNADADRGLARFSRVVPLAVGAILVSGVALAVIQMGPPGAHWLSPYGGILASKLLLLALLFALAIWNRWRLTGPALAGEIIARHRLRRSIRAEIVIIVLILGLVAGWRFTPPPRALAEATAAADRGVEATFVHVMDANAMVDMTVTPGRAGPVSIDLAVSDAAGAPAVPQAIMVTLSAPELGIEPLRYEAVVADGFWRVEGATIPIAGQWTISLDIRMSRFSLIRLETQLDIP